MPNPFQFNPFDISNLRQQNIFAQNPFSMSPPEQQIAGENPFQMPRMQQQFQPPAPQAPAQPQQQSYIDELISLTNRLYTPQTQATDRFNKLLDSAPQMNNPSMARGLMSGLINVGANSRGKELVDNSNAVLYAPYLREQAAWSQKTAPFQQAASLENSANNIERQLAGNMATNVTAQRRADQAAQTATDRNASAERIAAMREGVRMIISTYPQAKWNFDGEEATITDITGQTRGTGIKSADIDMPTRLALQSGKAGGPATGSGAPNMGGDIKDVVQDDAGNQFRYVNGQWIDMRTNQPGVPKGRVYSISGYDQYPPTGGGTTPKPQTPDDREGLRQEMFRNIYRTRPDYQQFLIPNEKGVYEIGPKPQRGMFTGRAAEDDAMRKYNELIQAAYPGTPQIYFDGEGPATNQVRQPQAQAQPQPQQQQPQMKPEDTQFWLNRPDPFSFQGMGGIFGIQPPSQGRQPVGGANTPLNVSPQQVQTAPSVQGRTLPQAPPTSGIGPSVNINPGSLSGFKGVSPQQAQQPSQTPQLTNEQQMAAIQAGERLIIQHSQNPMDIGTIPNTPEAIADAVAKKYIVRSK